MAGGGGHGGADVGDFEGVEGRLCGIVAVGDFKLVEMGVAWLYWVSYEIARHLTSENVPKNNAAIVLE